MEKILLVIGYILAVPPLLVIVPALIKKPRQLPAAGWMAAEIGGTALIVLGWALMGNWISVAINGTWLVIAAILWLRQSSRRTA